MTDKEVIDEVRNAQRIYKSSVTRATKRCKVAADKAFAFFGPTDVEMAARQNAIQRAEATCASDIGIARQRLLAVYASLRDRAGQWAELVPEAA